jgi:DNA-binding PadR family transcriptional regulator
MTTLGYALIGLLAKEALTGYELAARLKTPIGFYWTARHSQIYPELTRLVEAGLVTWEAASGPGPRDKKVYVLTGTGLAALRAWVTEPPGPRVHRDELLLKTYALWLADPAEALALYRAQRALRAERLARHEAVRARVEAAQRERLERVDTPEFADYATLRRGIGYEAEYLAWLDWLIECLEQAAGG